MEEKPKKPYSESRRTLLKGLGLVSLAPLVGLTVDQNSPAEFVGKASQDEPINEKKVYGGKTIRLGIIGSGSRGRGILNSIGFASDEWKENKKTNNPASFKVFESQDDLNVEVLGVCDVFDHHANEALKAVGSQAKRYTHYKDLLANKKIDAVIIATPDHWHAQITIDAAKAGKHVYCEKCLTSTLDEVYEVRKAVKESDIVFQLGHQLRQIPSTQLAKEIIEKGQIGDVCLIHTNSNRNSKNGAWVYNIHKSASPTTIDWKQFEKFGKQPFDKDRFFRWRKYWDYGTGLFGDLMTHDYDSMNHILSLGIPESASASGGIYHWKDGREVPDVLQVVMEYPKRNFSYIFSASQASSYERKDVIMGRDATIEMGTGLFVRADENSERYHQYSLEDNLIDPETKSEQVDGISGATSQYFERKGLLFADQNGKKVNVTNLHVAEWVEAIRNGTSTMCNIDQAFQEAITAHMGVKAYQEGRAVHWDAEKEEIV